MESIERFDIIGDVNVKVYKSSNNNYSFYLKASNKNVINIADVLDNTLSNFKTN